MCTPEVATGLTVASGLLDYQGQRDQAKAIKAQNEHQRALIEQDRINKHTQVHTQALRENEQALQQLDEAQMRTVKAASLAEVAAGEGGVTGNSVDAILADFYRDEAGFADSVMDNLEFNNQQRSLTLAGIESEAQSRLNSLPIPSSPSFLGTALSTGVDAFGTYVSMDSLSGSSSLKKTNYPKPVLKPSSF